MNKKIIGLLLLVNIIIGIFLVSYKINEVPPCLNADEAAFGYNAYSILKTGKDEYGAMMPLRLKSFEDYKLPLYSYLSVPFIGMFGLNDFSIRFLNYLIAVAFIPLAYFWTKELFKNQKIALLASFLVAVNPGLYIMSRHAHEGVLCTFFILLSLLFFVKWVHTHRFWFFVGTNLAILAASYSYHTGRLFLLFIILAQIFVIFLYRKTFIKKSNVLYAVIIAAVLILPFLADARYGANRVAKLFFIQNIGFHLRVTENINEHPNRLIHNKATESLREVTNRYFSQISPDFFIINGDKTPRFGMSNLGIITAIEYILFFIGLYFLFRNKEKFRFLLLFLIAIAPINNALTWQDNSLIRTYFMIFPLLIVAAYGGFHLYRSFTPTIFRLPFFVLVFSLFGFFLYNNWDMYFNHYAKKQLTYRAWQCGYKDMVSYVKNNYNKFDQFVITDRQGMPYIFVLYYMGYDPAKYQSQASISAPDKYGFGQIEKFDKFLFKFDSRIPVGNKVFIGYPDEFNDLIKDSKIDASKIKKIPYGTEDMFWIYEGR